MFDKVLTMKDIQDKVFHMTKKPLDFYKERKKHIIKSTLYPFVITICLLYVYYIFTETEITSFIIIGSFLVLIFSVVTNFFGFPNIQVIEISLSQDDFCIKYLEKNVPREFTKNEDDEIEIKMYYNQNLIKYVKNKLLGLEDNQNVEKIIIKNKSQKREIFIFSDEGFESIELYKLYHKGFKKNEEHYHKLNNKTIICDNL